MIKYANGECQNDSTFILERLDSLYPARPILPGDPVSRFLALLLEDMFDEWGTKIMFGLRWLEARDQHWSARYLLYDGQIGKGQPLKQVAESYPTIEKTHCNYVVTVAQLEELGAQFGARQVDRMKMVGCDQAEVVLRSFTSLAAALEQHLQNGSFFMLGGSPTAADFALYGQLSQLLIDRTGDE